MCSRCETAFDDPMASSCRRCGFPNIEVQHIFKDGRRYILGQLDARTVAIWDKEELPDPVFTAPAIERGRANQKFELWERAETNSEEWVDGDNYSSGHRSELVGFLVTVAIVVAIYIAYHAYKYHGCSVQPGIFAWPSSCL